MSTLLGDAKIRIRPDTTGFESETKSSITGSMGRIAKAAAVAFGTATVAAGGFGLKIAADMEQAQIGFETMLGSGEKAKKFLNDLQKFAAKTPFEFPELQAAASKLTAVGTNTEQIIPLMTALGDSTAAMGTGAEGIDRAVLALQQMRVKGKVTGEEMLQLAEAGVPAWEALASQLGVTTGEAQDMVSKGQVSVDDLYTAIETRQGESLSKTAGMMSKQAQSLSGLWSTVKDTVQMQLAGMMEPLIPSIKAGLDKAAPLLEAGLGGIRDTMKVLFTGDFQGGMFGGALMEDSKYVDVLFKIRDGFINVRDTFKILFTGDFQGGMFGGKVEEDSKYVGLLFDLREMFKSIWDSIKTGVGAVFGAVKELGPLLPLAFGGALAAAQYLAPMLQKVASFLADNKEITLILVGAFAAYRLAVLGAAVAQQVLNAAMKANPIGLIVTGLTALVAGVVYAWNNIGGFRDFILTAWEHIKAAWQTAWENVLKPVLTNLWELISTLWTSVLQPIFGLMGSVLMATFDLMAWAWNNILKPVFDGIGSVVGFLWNTILQPIFAGIGAAWDGLGKGIGWVWDNVLKPIFDTFGKVVGGIREAFESAVSGIGTAWDTLKSIVGAPVKWVVDLVWNNGLMKAWNTLNNIWDGEDLKPVTLDFARGGIMPGYTPGRDVHQFFSPTGGVLNLSGGEGVLRPEVTRGLGEDTINAWNAAARNGGVGGVRRALSQSFEDGGIINLPGWINKSLDVIGLDWILGFIDDVNKSPHVKVLGDMVSKVSGALWDAGWNLAKAIVGGNKDDQIVWDPNDVNKDSNIVLSQGGSGKLGGSWTSIRDVVQAAIPQARVNSAVRNTPDAHGRGKAVDFGFGSGPGGAGSPGLAQINRFLYDNFASNLYELIYDGIGDDRADIKNGVPHTYNTGTRNQHRNHVHAAVYDSGGILKPGLTLAHNLSGRDEYIFTKEQAEALEGSLIGGNLNITVGNGSSVRDAVDETLYHLRRIRRGGAYATR